MVCEDTERWNFLLLEMRCHGHIILGDNLGHDVAAPGGDGPLLAGVPLLLWLLILLPLWEVQLMLLVWKAISV